MTPREDDPPEARHIEVEPYGDDERVTPPPWYDDTVNVGDEANRDARR